MTQPRFWFFKRSNLKPTSPNFSAFTAPYSLTRSAEERTFQSSARHRRVMMWKHSCKHFKHTSLRTKHVARGANSCLTIIYRISFHFHPPRGFIAALNVWTTSQRLVIGQESNCCVCNNTPMSAWMFQHLVDEAQKALDASIPSPIDAARKQKKVDHLSGVEQHEKIVARRLQLRAQTAFLLTNL